MNFDIPDWGGTGGFSYHLDVPESRKLSSCLSELRKDVEGVQNSIFSKKRKSSEADSNLISKRKRKKESVKSLPQGVPFTATKVTNGQKMTSVNENGDHIRSDGKSSAPSSDKFNASPVIQNVQMKKKNRNKYKELHVRQMDEKGKKKLGKEKCDGSRNKEDKLAKSRCKDEGMLSSTIEDVKSNKGIMEDIPDVHNVHKGENVKGKKISQGKEPLHSDCSSALERKRTKKKKRRKIDAAGCHVEHKAKLVGEKAQKAESLTEKKRKGSTESGTHLINGVIQLKADSPPKRKKRKREKTQTSTSSFNGGSQAEDIMNLESIKSEKSTNTVGGKKHTEESEKQDVFVEKMKKKKKSNSNTDVEKKTQTCDPANEDMIKQKKKKISENNTNVLEEKGQTKESTNQDIFGEKKKKKRKKKLKSNTVAVEGSGQTEDSNQNSLTEKEKKKLPKSTEYPNNLEKENSTQNITVTKVGPINGTSDSGNNNSAKKIVESGKKISNSINNHGKLKMKLSRNKANPVKAAVQNVAENKNVSTKSRKKLKKKEEESDSDALVFGSDVESSCDPKLMSDLDTMIRQMKFNRFQHYTTPDGKNKLSKKQGHVLLQNTDSEEETDDNYDSEWKNGEEEGERVQGSKKKEKNTVTSLADKIASAPSPTSRENAAHNSDFSDEQKQRMGETAASNTLTSNIKNVSPSVKERVRFDKKKLSQLLDEARVSEKPPEPVVETLKEKMEKRLTAAKFRFVNEQLYTSTSQEAVKLFKLDPTAFSSYHQGYQDQVKSWPINPLDLIVDWLCTKPKEWVVADLGCGEALLSFRAPQTTVHSFDLVAANPRVTACDMAHTPLASGCVDVAVFCLSLMGTNVADFVAEANRILKDGGIMKIAEVESRFADTSSFVSVVKQFGFHSISKDISHPFFHLFEFKKFRKIKNKHILPQINLKACVYKKR